MNRPIRQKVGHWVFNHLLHPPKDERSSRLKPHCGDYGHAFLYEPLFCREETDIENILSLSEGCRGEILDLAGGAGRVAQSLAQNGKRVTLVDASRSMLHHAIRRRNYLGRIAQEGFSVVEQDIAELQLDRTFEIVFSVNNGLEHLIDEGRCREALERVAEHLERGGRFYLDVHHLEHWDGLPRWKRNSWEYGMDLFHQGARYRVWERTRSAVENEGVVWEHAVSSDLKQYTLLKTELSLKPKDVWCDLLRDAGLNVSQVWGAWDRTPLTRSSSKLIIESRKS